MALNTCIQQVFSAPSVSGPYMKQDIFNCDTGRLHVANNYSVLSVNLGPYLHHSMYFMSILCHYDLAKIN